MAFSDQQVRKLKAKLKAQHVRLREAEGQTLSYLEGWHVVAEANRIFGFDGWDRETVSNSCVWTKQMGSRYCAAYVARVRITVRAGEERIIREGSGSGESNELTPGQAHDRSSKAAETDATKRALITFGNCFGLTLYAAGVSQVLQGGRVPRPAASPVNGHGLEKQTRIGLAGHIPLPADARRQSTADARPAANGGGSDTGTSTMNGQKAASACNEGNEGGGRDGGAAVVTGATGFEAGLSGTTAPLHQDRDATPWQPLTPNESSSSLEPQSSPGTSAPDRSSPSNLEMVDPVLDRAERPAIDKAMLTIAEPKRVRDPEHLKFVADQPCMICGRQPCEAHHLRYVQPRALGRKSSDAYTVPLCALHHRELHTRGDERAWWSAKGRDPLPMADQLWLESSGRGLSQPKPDGVFG